MLLTAMLRRELIKELDFSEETKSLVRYEKYRAFAALLNIDVPSVEFFINSTDTLGMIHVDFLNKLFERYRHKIINPIKKNMIEETIDKNYSEKLYEPEEKIEE